jgi:hypothetical protein
MFEMGFMCIDKVFEILEDGVFVLMVAEEM